MFDFISSLIAPLFVNESEYIEFWDNYPDKLSIREQFLLNLNQEDLWNIDFYNRLILANQEHLKLLAMEGFYGEEIILL
jgi:hypothetical protein